MVHNVLTAEMEQLLAGHAAAVVAAAFFQVPGDLLAVTGSWDTTVKVWSTTVGECLATLRGHRGRVTDLAVSKKGYAASASEDGTVIVWSLNGDQSKKVVTLDQYHTAAVTKVLFNKGGNSLVSASADGSVCLWDMLAVGKAAAVGEAPKCQHLWEKHRAAILDVAFSPDSKHVVTGSDDGTARMWSVVNGKCSWTLKGHGKGVTSVAFSPDKRFIATGSDDFTARLWSILGRECLAVCKGHLGPVSSITFTPDNSQFATSSLDRSVRLYTTSSRLCIGEFKTQSKVLAAQFAPKWVDYGAPKATSSLMHESKHKLDLRAAVKEKSDWMRLKMDLKAQQLDVKNQVTTFQRKAAVNQARREQAATKAANDAQRTAEIDNARSNVHKAKQAHFESTRALADAQATRNAALRDEARILSENARFIREKQVAEDRKRIETLAKEQAEERIRRQTVIAKIADDKARMVAAKIEQEKLMRLKAEQREQEEKALKEQQHREMRERNAISRAAREQIEAERRESKREQDAKDRAEAARRRRDAEEDFAKKKETQRRLFIAEKKQREEAQAAAKEAQVELARREKAEVARQRAEAKAQLMADGAAQRAHKAEKRAENQAKKERARKAAIFRQHERERELAAQQRAEEEGRDHMRRVTLLAAKKRQQEKAVMVSKAKQDGARQIRNLVKLHPHLKKEMAHFVDGP